ncbi:MAG: homocysteine S-methyltransferase family protein [Pseudomonadota bacterium]
MTQTRAERAAKLREMAAKRILVKDGPYGTEIQRRKLNEADFRGERFADHPSDLKGNNDILSLTRPDVLRDIARDYIAAGADLLATNTFNANSISQADYGTESVTFDINKAAAKLLRQECDAASTPEKPLFVAGSIGPTNKTLSVSPKVSDPGYREVTFDEVKNVYREQVEGLLDGGADVILVETVFDSLNAKAALFAASEAGEEREEEIPVMVSLTLTDMAGRNLSGQSPEAFWYSVRHVKPILFGLNCSFGAKDLRAYVASLSKITDTLICVYPNAGLPNDLGEYDEAPNETAALIEEWADNGLINMIGGCCGTTPDHIAAIGRAVAGHPPRPIPQLEPRMRLAGIDPHIF